MKTALYFDDSALYSKPPRARAVLAYACAWAIGLAFTAALVCYPAPVLLAVMVAGALCGE